MRNKKISDNIFVNIYLYNRKKKQKPYYTEYNIKIINK